MIALPASITLTRKRERCTEQAVMPGELIYENAAQITQLTEYGVVLNTLLSGAAPTLPGGARFDAHVEGTAH